MSFLVNPLLVSKTPFHQLGGKDRFKVVCIDLSTPDRSLVRQLFPNALIVADRFHVIRLMNQIQRRAYGFRNFENDRIRVKVLCGG